MIIPVGVAVLLALVGVVHPILDDVPDHDHRSPCFYNDSGFLCCDRLLESVMKAAMAKYDQGGRRDLLAVAKGVQSAAEKALGGKFETVVAFADFAHISHFKDSKSCKVEKDGQVALAWQP